MPCFEKKCCGLLDRVGSEQNRDLRRFVGEQDVIVKFSTFEYLNLVFYFSNLVIHKTRDC